MTFRSADQGWAVPQKNAESVRKNRRTAQKDQTDRIEIERYFSVAKRRNGMGLVMRKRKDTSLATIAMSILVTNIFGSFSAAVVELEKRAVLEDMTVSNLRTKSGCSS